MKPRLVFVLAEFVNGGAERQTVLLAKQMIAAGYSCTLLAYYARHSAFLIDDEIRPHVRFVGGRAMRSPLEWRKAWSMLAELDADLVLAVNESAATVAVAGRTFGFFDAKIACVLHTTELPDMKTRLTFTIARMALLRTDCLVYVCRAQQKFWRARGLRAGAETVIYNGIDTTHFSPDSGSVTVEEAKGRLGLLPGDYVLGLTAAFRPEKNHLQAVEALAALRSRGLPAKLLLVGDGATLPEIERLVASMHLQEHVVFAGSQRDVRPFLRALDVGLLCSTSVETFSMAALECMAMGIPMVMPRMSGCVEMLDRERGGRLFAVGSTEDLVQQLLDLSNPSLRTKLAGEARAVVVECFTQARMVESYAALFGRMTSEALASNLRAPAH